MKETGLMFKAPLVRAILEGRKTQTRRVAKLPHMNPLGEWEPTTVGGPGGGRTRDGKEAPLQTAIAHTRTGDVICAPFQPGDRIYVRETWVDLIAVSPSSDEPMAIGPGERLIEAPTSWTDDKGRTRWNYDGQVIAYRANSNVEFCDGDGFSGEFADKSDMPRWRPSIHMPKEFARIWLEITGVRVERLQSISRTDAIAEGIQFFNGDHECGAKNYMDKTDMDYSLCPTDSFETLWRSTGGDWEANPWVWAIDFKTISTTGRPA